MGTYDHAILTQFWRELQQRLVPVISGYRTGRAAMMTELKPDDTFLTRADTEVQQLIIEAIVDLDSGAQIVAEEESLDAKRHAAGSEGGGESYSWIIDPIDGTSQFVSPGSRDFCTAVAILRNGYPLASALITYELFGEPVSFTCYVPEGVVQVAGMNVRTSNPKYGPLSREASVTGKRDATWPPIDDFLSARGYNIKRKATSQSVDLLRTCMTMFDARPYRLPPFDLFYREHQKFWDGCPGICLALAAGASVTSLHSDVHIPILTDGILGLPEFRSTLVGSPGLIREVATQLRHREGDA